LPVRSTPSLRPDDVAAQLREIGVDAQTDDVVTSAQAAATMLAARLPASSAVLVVGGDGLSSALVEAGLRPVSALGDDPVAVVSGFSPDLGWRLLAEGTFAVRSGLPWVATNLDRTVPTPRGPAPGNGAFVALVAAAAGRQPDEVAGKPQPALLQEAMRRTGARRALFVGDRLDTDAAGAVRAGVDSLLVLTGVSGPVDLLRATPAERPTFVAANLDGLSREHPQPGRTGDAWTCGGWSAARRGDRLDVSGSGTTEDGLRALCAAAWEADEPVGERSAADAVRAVGWAPEPRPVA
jgi:HAD superfamily hydrolase (TIGR01450 family)